MNLRFIIAICLMLVTTSAYADSDPNSNILKPFASDGCSSFPDGSIKQRELWLSCCTAHDYAYWKGGTFNDRFQADNELRVCVAQVGEPELAVLMMAGVRVGGSPFLPTSYRWGYGWSYPKFYGELTEDELAQVKAREAEAADADNK